MLERGVSIVIATFNGKKRLAETLTHLANQELTISCEIIFVDNASTDGTKAFADEWWKDHGTPAIQYASFEQPIPGKSYAQELGYTKAQYDYLLVCDDDNWLCKTYVQTAFETMDANPQIGALGGWCEAVFEKEKPVWFDQYARYFAVGKQGKESGDITTKKGCLYGAGMMIRKSHWDELNTLGFKPLLTCRKGNTLSSGGDTEYSYVLRLMGYKIWYDERLYFKHWMPEGRMSLDYITRIRKAMSESNFLLWIYKDEWHNRTVTPRVFYRKAYHAIKDDFLKQALKRMTGSFEERELAKEYFRNLYRLLTKHKEYAKNRATIKRWLPKYK